MMLIILSTQNLQKARGQFAHIIKRGKICLEEHTLQHVTKTNQHIKTSLSVMSGIRSQTLKHGWKGKIGKAIIWIRILSSPAIRFMRLNFVASFPSQLILYLAAVEILDIQKFTTADMLHDAAMPEKKHIIGYFDRESEARAAYVKFKSNLLAVIASQQTDRRISNGLMRHAALLSMRMCA